SFTLPRATTYLSKRAVQPSTRFSGPVPGSSPRVIVSSAWISTSRRPSSAEPPQPVAAAQLRPQASKAVGRGGRVVVNARIGWFLSVSVGITVAGDGSLRRARPLQTGAGPGGHGMHD